MMLVAVQYTANPLGTERVNQANMIGISHSIIWLVCAVCGLAMLVCVSESLVWSQVVIPTSTTMIVSGRPRSSQRNCVPSGTAA
jgi:hypothetical protein